MVALWDKTNLHAHNNTSGTRPIMKKKQGVSRELNVFIIMRTNTILRYFNSVYDRAVERIIPDCHHSLQNKSIFSNSVIVYSFFFFFFIGTRSLYFNQCLLQSGTLADLSFASFLHLLTPVECRAFSIESKYFTFGNSIVNSIAVLNLFRYWTALHYLWVQFFLTNSK